MAGFLLTLSLAWVLSEMLAAPLVKKIRKGEVSQPVRVNTQKKNRFVNFQQRDIDYEALEKQELELLKESMGANEQEEFVQ